MAVTDNSLARTQRDNIRLYTRQSHMQLSCVHNWMGD